jgi:phosphate transport system permease protein
MRWATAGALILAVAMIVGLLAFVAAGGFPAFWPGELIEIRQDDGTTRLGELAGSDAFDPSRAEGGAESPDGEVRRRLLRTGNFDLWGEHFTWVDDRRVKEESRPEWALVVEREAWGRFYGVPVAFRRDGEVVETEPAKVVAALDAVLNPVHDRLAEKRRVEKHEIGGVYDALKSLELKAKKAAMESGPKSSEAAAANARFEKAKADSVATIERLREKTAKLDAENARFGVELVASDGTKKILAAADVVRAYPANRLTFFERVGVYVDRWAEFLTEDPREANTEGGIFPALFGTVVMTLLMSLVVAPFGVLAALYLREYAKQGLVTGAVRIAVNNLAGVPSIVFGVFGLGFFCYAVGGRIDAAFFAERLPSPTFGTGGVLWASATLALLTLPVVIVSTEEALAAVPRSMREGSYACGASKWQTIRRIVLPRAAPGVMTGMILAMARGAGEVAPLMLVGVVKLAHELPIDGTAPFLHPERSFMHLGFHIFDLGFQSQNSEASKPMVYVTTTVLISVVVLLNVAAVMIRSRLRRRFVGGAF